MNDNLRRATISFAVFVIVCLVGTFALLAIFSQYRFAGTQTFRAEFTDVSGLGDGDFVRIAGVEVGKVSGISVTDDSIALVEFTVDPTVVLTSATRAAVRWENPIGDRYLALTDGPGASRHPSTRAAPSRSPTPNPHWTSTPCSADSARCSGRWIRSRSTRCRAS